MKAADVKIGEHYLVKVTGEVRDVVIVSEAQSGGWIGRNVLTGRTVRIRSAGKLRGVCPAALRVDQKDPAPPRDGVERLDVGQSFASPERMAPGAKRVLGCVCGVTASPHCPIHGQPPRPAAAPPAAGEGRFQDVT